MRIIIPLYPQGAAYVSGDVETYTDGLTTSILTLTGLSTTDSGSYQCIVKVSHFSSLNVHNSTYMLILQVVSLSSGYAKIV